MSMDSHRASGLKSHLCALAAFSALCGGAGFAQCSYDLNGVGYGTNCSYHGGSTGSGASRPNNYITPQQRRIMEQQAAVAAANARWQAALKAEADAEAANSAGAAKAVEEAAAANADYLAKRDQLAGMMRGDDGGATGMRGDDAGAIGTENGRRGDSVEVRHEGLAMRQLLGAAMGAGGSGTGNVQQPDNAACIADGRADCLKPVIRVVVKKDEPAMGKEEAAFLQHFPEKAQKDEKYKGWFDLYKSQARDRDDLHDKMVVDKKASDADPSDEKKKNQVMVDKGQLTAADADVKKTQDTIVSFHIPGVTLPPSMQSKGTVTSNTANNSKGPAGTGTAQSNTP